MLISSTDPRLERILRTLIARSFPRLRRLRFRIVWGGEEELLAYGVQDDQYLIWINQLLRLAPVRVLEGGIGHELCHIHADIAMGPYARELAWTRYTESRWHRIREERAAESRLVELGYGPHLLAFIRFTHRLGYSFSREHGLLYGEVLRAIQETRPR